MKTGHILTPYLFLFLLTLWQHSAAQGQSFENPGGLSSVEGVYCFPYSIATDENWELQPAEKGEWPIPRLTDAAFAQLTCKAKLAYYFWHNEKPIGPDKFVSFGLRMANRIYPHFPPGEEFLRPKGRMAQALRENRDSCIYYLRHCLKQLHAMELRAMYAAVEMEAWELVPALIQERKPSERRDEAHLTLLIQLMEKGRFAAWQTSWLNTFLMESGLKNVSTGEKFGVESNGIHEWVIVHYAWKWWALKKEQQKAT